MADKYTKSNGKTSEGIETAIPAEKQVDTQPESNPKLQPYFSDIYLKPEPSEQKQNGEICSETSTLESELADAKRVAKHNQGKAEMCSKNLASAKRQLEKANNVISIQKANIEALTSEVESLKTRLKNSDEVLERRLAEFDSRYSTCNGSTSRDSIESGFIKLQAKLQENEKALIRRTRELEKANESRKKVAKHTRALLIELEEKLTENNRRINELEEQLMNKTLDLQYEKEERKRIEQLTKDLKASSLYSKRREITKKSTELLQQAKEDHRLSKNEQKIQQEIESLNKKLQARNSEIEKLQERLIGADKKDAEVQKLETAFKKANEQLDSLRNELSLVNESYNKEKMKCSQLESEVQDISMKVCMNLYSELNA